MILNTTSSETQAAVFRAQLIITDLTQMAFFNEDGPFTLEQLADKVSLLLARLGAAVVVAGDIAAIISRLDRAKWNRVIAHCASALVDAEIINTDGTSYFIEGQSKDERDEGFKNFMSDLNRDEAVADVLYPELRKARLN